MKVEHCAHGKFSVVNCQICRGLNQGRAAVAKAKHTPTPWGAQFDLENAGPYPWHEINGDGIKIAELAFKYDREAATEQRNNAEFIVRAVNSHDALLSAARIALIMVSDELGGEWAEIRQTLTEAITKAEARL